MSAADGPIPTAADGGGAPVLSFLARQPLAVLGGLSAVALAFIAWAAVESPIPTLVGVVAWAALLFSLPLYRQARLAFAASPKAGTDHQRALAAVAASAGNGPALAFIGPDLVMEGRLIGPGEVEVFGRLSGAVMCDSVRVHKDGVLQAAVVYRRLTVAEGATFDGAARPMAVSHGGAGGVARSLPPVRKSVQRRGAAG